MNAILRKQAKLKAEASLIRLLHTIAQINTDCNHEDLTAAMDAVIHNNDCTYYTQQTLEQFHEETNSVAVCDNLERFEELCQGCIDFTNIKTL